MALSFKNGIQWIIVLLLLCAISLQLNLRQKTKRHGVTLQQQPKMLQDFLVHSAEREAIKEQRAELKAAESSAEAAAASNDDEFDNATIQASQLQHDAILQSRSGASAVVIPNITSLGCIDLVRKCMRFKAEKKPSLEKADDRMTADMNKTVALVSPVLKGGFRNQYMRFVALVATAMTNGHDILVESVKWHEKSSHSGIPFDMIYNVSIWNEYATTNNLPQMVYHNHVLHRQWNVKTTAFRGQCPAVIAWFQSPHKTSLLAPVKEMTLPYPAGGARSGQPGNLWDYYRARDKFGLQIELPDGSAISLQVLEERLFHAMQLSDVVQSLVDSLKPSTPYIALHPRIEPEMLDHRYCQDEKEGDLYKIINMVEKSFAETYKEIFVAVAMPQMVKPVKGNPKWNKVHNANLALLQDLFQRGHYDSVDKTKKLFHVWTAGEASLVDRSVNQCMITLLASLVNLELAIQSDVFIGTSVSTWSTSVWKMRHWRGTKENYIFTPFQGIQKLEGLPKPFRC